MSDLTVKVFGNGRQVISNQFNYIVETKEYHDLTVNGGSVILPPCKRFKSLGFNDSPLGSFVAVCHEGRVVDIDIKVVDYINQIE